MTVDKTSIGVDPLWTPAGFHGSPLLSAVPDLNSHLLVGYKKIVSGWPGITIMCWLQLDSDELPVEPQVLMSSRANAQLDSGWEMAINVDGTLQMEMHTNKAGASVKETFSSYSKYKSYNFRRRAFKLNKLRKPSN